MATIILGGRSISADTLDFKCSNADPGGYELCTFSLPQDTMPPSLGDVVIAFEGLEPIFYGRVDENAQEYTGSDGIPQISAVGAGAVLGDDEMSMVYVDRSYSRFASTARARQIASGDRPWGDGNVAPDQDSGLPALILQLDSVVTDVSSNGPTRESVYDAGQGNKIASVYYDYTTWDKGAGGANLLTGNWAKRITSSDTDGPSYTDAFTAFAAGSGSGTHTVSTPRRYLAFELFLNQASFTGTSEWKIIWRRLAFFGDHGLTKRGSTPDEGFYTSDIVGHVLNRIPTKVVFGIVQSNTDYVVPHAAYYEPVSYENIIDDMAKLEGYHWGVWTNANRVRTPYLDFRAGPTEATVFAQRSDCDAVRLSESLAAQHDTIRVLYTTPGGKSGYVTVTRANGRMGGISRSATVSMGNTGSSAAATAFGNMLLALEQAQARASGTVTIRGDIRCPGGRRPVSTLRAGIDKIKLTDLPGSLYIGADTRRFDTFRIQRVDITYDGAVPIATLSLDAGINLIEVLQARLALATDAVGGS